MELSRDRLAEAVVARCRKDRLEPPTPGRIARLVGAAVSTFEERFCAATSRVLRRVRHLFVNRANLRSALVRLVNATFAARDAAWWGEGMACASDSKKFGSWSSNFMTEWHQRYRGPGVMIYWHVEKKSLCVYSQPTCSASTCSPG